MVRDRLDNWCEKGILALLLAALVFGPLATGAVRPGEFLVVQTLTAAAALLWLARFWVNPRYRILWPPVCWAVTAFVIYAIVRYHQADIEYVARQELIRILVYALLFFIVLNNLVRQDLTQLSHLIRNLTSDFIWLPRTSFSKKFFQRLWPRILRTDFFGDHERRTF